MSKYANPFSKNANLGPEGETSRNLRWDDLEVLLALARAGTLSGAAQRLGVNTSTIGRRLDALEAALDVHLFDRSPTGISATEAAEALIPMAETMEHAVADALRVLEGRETEPEGVVRVTAPPGLANWFIAPRLIRLRERHPKLVIELDAAVGYADINRREADIAVRAARPRSGDLIAQRLAEAETIIVAAPELVRRIGKLERLDAIDWITWGSDLATFPDAEWVTQHVDPTKVVLRTSSMDAQLHAARAGLGAMLVARPWLGWIELEELPLARKLAKELAPMPVGTLWMVGHRALRGIPRIRAVWDFIAEEARELG